MPKAKVSQKDSLYTESIINKAKAHKCIVCDNYFTELEASNEDFHYKPSMVPRFSYIKGVCCLREG